MMSRAVLLVVLVASAVSAMQQSPRVDTSKIGTPVGAVVPAFEGIDQFGQRRSLSSVSGSKGTMLVFFRSADW